MRCAPSANWGIAFGVHTFRSSASIGNLLKKFGFMSEIVLTAVTAQISQSGSR